MTLRECLAAVRAEKQVALPEPVLADSETVAGGEEQSRSVNTAVSSNPPNQSPEKKMNSASDSRIYPRKPDDACGRSEIYPKSTCISPIAAVKLVQGEILLGTAQGDLDLENDKGHIDSVGSLGEKRVDSEVLRGDRVEGVGKAADRWPEVAATDARPAALKKPYFTSDGTLRIPFDSDPKYHWWKGGQSVKKTIAELRGEVLEEPPAEDVPSDCNY
jgi:hypothetical protein